MFIIDNKGFVQQVRLTSPRLQRCC
jgi:hypothetical protein